MFPPKSILAAVDFSEPSRVALTCAARFAKHCHAHLHVLNVLDPLLAGAAQCVGVDLPADTRSELGRFMQCAHPAEDWAPSHHVVTGNAVEGICDVAERESADLIVVGARGMSALHRAHFGSTTEGVLRKADTSVLVVPHSWAPPKTDGADLTGTGPVVVGLELTPPSIEAARAAGQLAKLLNTSLEIHHVVAPIPVLSRWSSHADMAMQKRLQSAKAEMSSALHYLVGADPSAVEVETGAVAECLARAVARDGGQHPWLVLGRRTEGERGGAPGSTAYRVLGLAEVPVLMYLPEH